MCITLVLNLSYLILRQTSQWQMLFSPLYICDRGTSQEKFILLRHRPDTGNSRCNKLESPYVRNIRYSSTLKRQHVIDEHYK